MKKDIDLQAPGMLPQFIVWFLTTVKQKKNTLSLFSEVHDGQPGEELLELLFFFLKKMPFTPPHPSSPLKKEYVKSDLKSEFLRS